MTTGGRDIRRNVIKSAFLSLSVLRHWTFRQISRRPVFVEESKYHHSNRLVEASRMVVFSFFYNHWAQRYLTKRYQIGVFITFGTAPFDVSSNISASSGRGEVNLPPFDSSRQAGSNGGIPILLWPLDVEIFDETSNGAVLKHRFNEILSINSASNGRGRMGIPPFDSSRRAGSNGGILIRLWPLDAEIFDETSNGAVPKVIKTPIWHFAN